MKKKIAFVLSLLMALTCFVTGAAAGQINDLQYFADAASEPGAFLKLAQSETEETFLKADTGVYALGETGMKLELLESGEDEAAGTDGAFGCIRFSLQMTEAEKADDGAYTAKEAAWLDSLHDVLDALFLTETDKGYNASNAFNFIQSLYTSLTDRARSDSSITSVKTKTTNNDLTYEVQCKISADGDLLSFRVWTETDMPAANPGVLLRAAEGLPEVDGSAAFEKAEEPVVIVETEPEPETVSGFPTEQIKLDSGRTITVYVVDLSDIADEDLGSYAKKAKKGTVDKNVTTHPFEFNIPVLNCAALRFDFYVQVQNGKPFSAQQRCYVKNASGKWVKGDKTTDFTPVEYFGNAIEVAFEEPTTISAFSVENARAKQHSFEYSYGFDVTSVCFFTEEDAQTYYDAIH